MNNQLYIDRILNSIKRGRLKNRIYKTLLVKSRQSGNINLSKEFYSGYQIKQPKGVVGVQV